MGIELVDAPPGQGAADRRAQLIGEGHERGLPRCLEVLVNQAAIAPAGGEQTQPWLRLVSDRHVIEYGGGCYGRGRHAVPLRRPRRNSAGSRGLTLPRRRRWLLRGFDAGSGGLLPRGRGGCPLLGPAPVERA